MERISNYTNEDLANDYAILMLRVYVNDRAHRKEISRNSSRISQLTIDLPIFYGKNNSLASSGELGVDNKTRGILELILGKGFSEAEKILGNGKVISR